jgi:hypothetical protein
MPSILAGLVRACQCGGLEAICPVDRSQNSAGARPASDLLRLSLRGVSHQQRPGAKAVALRDPAKDDQRLPKLIPVPAPLWPIPSALTKHPATL